MDRLRKRVQQTPLFGVIAQRHTVEAAKEKQGKYYNKLDELKDSGKYTEEAVEEVIRKYLYPRRSI